MEQVTGAQMVAVADFETVAAFVEIETKRLDQFRSARDAIIRIGSLANAEQEHAQRLEARRAEADQEEQRAAAAREALQGIKAEGERILDEAHAEAARIVERARSDAQGEKTHIDKQIEAKRQELADVSARLARAQEALK